MKKELREKIWRKYDCKCAYCGEDLKYKEMQVDHIEAKCLGGKDDIENYNPSCRQCNFYKGTFSLDGFKKQLATINERIQKPFIVRLAMKYGLISFKPFDGKFYYEKRNEQLTIPRVSNSALQENTKLIDNMCISYRHDFGLMNKEQQDKLRFECKEWLRAYENNREHCC